MRAVAGNRAAGDGREPDVARVFAELGASIERRWAADAYQRRSFPEIAVQQLLAFDIPGQVGAGAVNEWVLAAEQLPKQDDPFEEFGQPPVTVFRGRHFSVSVLYWRMGITGIHEHSFSGAFQVLDGASVHAQYDFAERTTLNECVQLGALTRGSLELFEVGRVQPIHSGPGYIHELVHLGRPSATIVVRTDREPWALPQHSYWRSGVRYDPHFKDRSIDRQLSLIQTLGADHAAAARALSRLLCGPDPQVTIHVLDWLQRADLAQPHVHAAVAPLRERSPELAALLLAAHAQQISEKGFLRACTRLEDPGHQFLVLLSAVTPDTSELTRILRAYQPDADPAALYAQWTSEIAATIVPATAAPWARLVARSLLRGDNRAATIAQAHVEQPQITEAELRTVEDLHRRFPETPILATLLEQNLDRTPADPLYGRTSPQDNEIQQLASRLE